MRRNNLLPLLVLGVLGFLAYKKSKESTIPYAAATLLPEGGYTEVPTFKAEWAGSELYAQTGTVLPSGAARDLIR